MLTVHMKQPLCPGAFVEIVNVLGDDQHFAPPFRVQLRERPVCGIGLRFLDMRATHVVEPQHQIGIARKAFGRRDIFNAVLFPKPATLPKRADPRFSADARPSKDHDIADLVHRAHEA